MPVIKSDQIQLQEVNMQGVLKTVKANIIGPDQGWKDYTLRVFKIGPGGYTPCHQHDWEHINFIIKGKGTLTLGSDVHEISEGDYAFVPSNIMHQFNNPHDEELEFICIVPNRGA